MGRLAASQHPHARNDRPDGHATPEAIVQSPFVLEDDVRQIVWKWVELANHGYAQAYAVGAGHERRVASAPGRSKEPLHGRFLSALMASMTRSPQGRSIPQDPSPLMIKHLNGPLSR